MNFPKFPLLAGLAVVGMLASMNPALAYIPPSGFIIKNVAAKHTNLKHGVRVKAEVISMNPANTETLRFKSILVYDAPSRTFRAWALDAADRKLFQVERKADALTLAESLAFEPQANQLENLLIAKGVPILTEKALLEMPDEAARQGAETLSLKRWKNNPCWVIGHAGPTQSELWVEKDTFLPVRLVFGKSVDSNISEIQFDGYRYQYSFAFAKVTSAVDRGGIPVLREELRDIFVGTIANDLKGTLAPGFTEEGKSVSGPLREMIEQYFKYLR